MTKIKLIIAPIHYKIDRSEGSEYARAYDYLMYLSNRKDISGDVLVGYSNINRLGNLNIHSFMKINPDYISIIMRIRFVFWIFLKSLILIFKNKYDIIWHNGPFAIGETFSLVSIINFRKIPLILGPIVTPHVYEGGDEYRSMGNKLLRDSLLSKFVKFIDSKIYFLSVIFRKLSNITLSRSSLVLLKENETLKLISHIKNIKTKVLNLGLNLDDIRKNKVYKRSKYIKLLNVSYFVKRKNTTDLILAMDYIVNKLKYVNYRLYLVGDGPDMTSIKQQVSMYNLKKYVKFFGFVKKENIFDHYIKSDVFVSTSLSDSMPAMYFEAMAAGLPIITYSNPSSQELRNMGAKIFQIRMGKFEDFATTIVSITKNNKMFKLGKINKSVYDSVFSFKRRMGHFVKIMKDLKKIHEN